MIQSMFQLAGNLTSKNKLSILIFHQVMEQFDPMRPTEPTADIFRWQMALVAKYFNPLPLQKAVHLLKEKALPANSICVTFDDGYLDNLQVAQPILAQFNVPATVFISTGFSNGKNMWNDRVIDLVGDSKRTQVRLSSLQMPDATLASHEDRREIVRNLIGKLKYLDIDTRRKAVDNLYEENQAEEYPSRMMCPKQIRQLSDTGVEIGAHTVDHPILKEHTEQQQREQMLDSKQTLEAWLEKPVNGFAYPNGKRGTDYDDTSARLAREVGFDYAVTTDWGVSTPDTNVYELQRFSPWDRTPAKYHMRLMRNQFSG